MYNDDLRQKHVQPRQKQNASLSPFLLTTTIDLSRVLIWPLGVDENQQQVHTDLDRLMRAANANHQKFQNSYLCHPVLTPVAIPNSGLTSLKYWQRCHQGHHHHQQQEDNDQNSGYENYDYYSHDNWC